MNRLALELIFRPVEEANIAGLLHDIGKLVLSARTPTACAPLLADPTQANPLSIIKNYLKVLTLRTDVNPSGMDTRIPAIASDRDLLKQALMYLFFH